MRLPKPLQLLPEALHVGFDFSAAAMALSYAAAESNKTNMHYLSVVSEQLLCARHFKISDKISMFLRRAQAVPGCMLACSGAAAAGQNIYYSTTGLLAVTHLCVRR